MDVFAEYLNGASKVLLAEFERIKSTKSDSGVKGGRLEGKVRTFLEENTACWNITNNSELIDSYGKESMEQDVCLCNRWQTFKSKDNEKLICEGVDCVVQVKSLLDTKELKRILKNSNSVKMLQSRLDESDLIRGKQPEFKEYMVPYYALVGRSSLKPETVITQLNANINDKQPDAIFLLDRGVTLLNTAIGQASVFKAGSTVPRKPAGWWTLDTGDLTLFHFLDRLNKDIESIARFTPPINFYFKGNMRLGPRTKMPNDEEVYTLEPAVAGVKVWRSNEDLVKLIKSMHPHHTVEVDTGWAKDLVDAYVGKAKKGREKETKKLVESAPCITIKNADEHIWMRCNYIQYDLLLVTCDIATKHDVEALANKIDFKVVRALDERDGLFHQIDS